MEIKRLEKGVLLGLRDEIATCETGGEKIKVTRSFANGAINVECEDANYRISLQTIVEEVLAFRDGN
jgi:hypothetical protein